MQWPAAGGWCVAKSAPLNSPRPGRGFTPLRLYFGSMADAENRYELTGLSPVERDELIVKLRKQGWTQAAIATRLHMTQPGVLYALQRLAGRPRKRPKPDDDLVDVIADDDDRQFWEF